MGGKFILTFLLITLSYINAQDYVLLDESDFNIWDSEEQNPILETDKTVTYLCDNYYVTVNNERIECADIQLIPKTEAAQNAHVVHRREVDDTELEGSGNGADEQIAVLPEIPSPNKTSILSEHTEDEIPPENLPKEEKPEENNENVESQISNFKEANLAENVEDTQKPNETNIEDDHPIEAINTHSAETKIEIPSLVGSDLYNETSEKAEPKNVDSVQPDSQNVANNPVDIPETVEAPVPEVVEKVIAETTTTIKNEEIVDQEKPALPPLVQVIASTTQNPIAPVLKTDNDSVSQKEESNVDSSGSKNDDSGKENESKVPPKVLPNDLAEVDPINDQKEAESINPKQSGNAVLLKAPKADGDSAIEGSETDKVLQGMAENAKISNEPTEQPSTGESAKTVSKAGKDTTILIVLFVVVIAIGGAAFTHNFIKKRKQQAASNNDLVNGIRRSLQNLSSNNGKTNSDVEQGTELKPLMKNNSPINSKE